NAQFHAAVATGGDAERCAEAIDEVERAEEAVDDVHDAHWCCSVKRDAGIARGAMPAGRMQVWAPRSPTLAPGGAVDTARGFVLVYWLPVRLLMLWSTIQ